MLPTSRGAIQLARNSRVASFPTAFLSMILVTLAKKSLCNLSGSAFCAAIDAEGSMNILRTSWAADDLTGPPLPHASCRIGRPPLDRRRTVAVCSNGRSGVDSFLEILLGDHAKLPLPSRSSDGTAKPIAMPRSKTIERCERKRTCALQTLLASIGPNWAQGACDANSDMLLHIDTISQATPGCQANHPSLRTLG